MVRVRVRFRVEVSVKVRLRLGEGVSTSSEKEWHGPSTWAFQSTGLSPAPAVGEDIQRRPPTPAGPPRCPPMRQKLEMRAPAFIGHSPNINDNNDV